jgi:amino acid adenylation domain-containing protein
MGGVFHMFRESQVRHAVRLVPEETAQTVPREIHGRELACEHVSQWVAAHASVHPSAPAIVAGTDTITYAELDARSSQLARHLKSLGVGPDRLVGLCIPRSPAMVIAALAVLKAGGAYVPLDPSLPAARLNFMLRDSGVEIVVTQDPVGPLPGGPWRHIDLSKDAVEIAAHASDTFQCPVTDGNLAYVIYTSGSTGQPKGVEITHQGLANLVSWHCRAFQVTGRDRASHQAAIGFDASVWEIWPYLTAGASVHIPDDAVRNDPAALRDWLVAHRISITFVPTPMAERMMRLEWPRDTALRVLLTGADTLHQRPSSKLPFILVNNYGPTEYTVVATSGVVAPAEDSKQAPSIGKPIDHTRAYILDEGMQPVPAGTMGELYVSGAGLARGYHNLPELTRERFLRDPYSSLPGARMYRTGDLARFLDTGEIEFLGRVDEQIKIRGFRVEPREIVRVLDEHGEVEASAVVAAESHAQDKKLVAYVVISPQSALTASSLREHLRKQLPDYMIPAAFVRTDSLPLTANGKLDRGLLPRPEAGNMLREDDFVSPQSIVEQRLAPIVASLLHVERIGANDNFFFLGGHSLLGTQLLTKISEVFGVDLTLLQLFDHPTLAEMSREIEKLILLKLETAAVAKPDGGQSGQKRSA